MKFKHCHSSSRFNRSPSSLLAAVKSYIAQGYVLITLTETEEAIRKDAIRKVPHFQLLTGSPGGRDDCSILFDTRVFHLVAFNQLQLSHKRYIIFGHRSSPVYAACAVLEVVATGKRILVAVIHTNSSVETDLNRNNKTLSAVAWTANNSVLRYKVNKFGRMHKAKAYMLCGDWNINFHNQWTHRLMKTYFPKWTLNWTKHMIPQGTHGGRLIDGTLFRGAIKILRTWIEKDDASSDHRPYGEEVELN